MYTSQYVHLPVHIGRKDVYKESVSRLASLFCLKQCQLRILIRWTALKLEKLLVDEKSELHEPLYQTSQATKMNFENLLGEKVYKKHNYNPY